MNPLKTRQIGRVRERSSLILEPLEQRLLLSVSTSWTGAAGDNQWATPGNWSNGAPTGSVDAIISLSGADVKITAGASAAGITSSAGTTIEASGDTFSLGADPSTIAGALLLDGATLSIGAGSVTLSGSTTWSGGDINTNGNALTNTGAMTLSDASFVTLYGDGTLVNQGTIEQTGAGELAFYCNVPDLTTLDNQAGATYEFLGDGGAATIEAGGTFTNEGTITASAGAGETCRIQGIQFINKGGTIGVQTGTLTLESAGGTSTGGTFDVAAGATLDLTGGQTPPVSYAGTYTGSGAGTVLLEGGFLELGGATTFNFPTGMFQWTGGEINTNGYTLTNAAGGYMTLSNAGPVTLAGDGTLANQGTIEQTGSGALAFYSTAPDLTTLDNQAGSTYEFVGDGGAENFNFYGTFTNEGTITASAGTGETCTIEGIQFINNGGTISVQTGTLALESVGGTSTGGTFDVASGATLDLTGGQATPVSYAGTYTGSGGGTVLLEGGELDIGAAGATFNFPTGMFQWTGGRINTNGNSLTNASTAFITISSAKAIQLYGGGDFANAGTVDVLTGTSLEINCVTTNSGAITGTGATINLAGTYSATSTGTCSSSGGTVDITGTVDNTGQTLALNATSGSWNLEGGTIQGGTLSETGGAELLFPSSGVTSSGTLDGVTIDGGLDLEANGNNIVTIADGLTLNGGTIQMGNAAGTSLGVMNFSNTETLGGTGTVLFGASTYSSFSVAAGSTLTIGSGIAVEGTAGGASLTGSSQGSIINLGTISANVSGGTIQMAPSDLTNDGTLEATNGATLSFSGTSLENGGTLQAAGGVLNLNGAITNTGTLAATTSGAIEVTGSLTTNGQGTLTGDGTGSLTDTGNLLGDTTNATGYNDLETVTLNGSGNAGNPQLVEAMSNDVGALASGFSGNFAYTSLALANKTYVELVDQANNSGSGSPEAVYANTVDVPTGCTLDVNGLHVYAQTVRGKGTVVGGSITTVSSAPSYTLIDPISPLMHGTEQVAWAATGVDVTGMTANVSIINSAGILSSGESTPIATGAGAVGSVSWDTTAVADGLYDLQVVFSNSSGTVVGQAAKQVTVNNTAAWYSGTITSNETWTNSQVNVVYGTVTVASGVTLTIEPGAVVKFVQGANLQIVLQSGATLNASAATASSPIIFTSFADDSVGGDTNLASYATAPEPGDWAGFSVASGANLNLNQYVQLDYMLQTWSGTLSSNETWLATSVDEVAGNIVVPSGVTLTILPGAVVKFDAGIGMDVQAGGQLIAEGTVAQPIIFTSVNDNSYGGEIIGSDGSPQPGDWGQISNEGTTTMDHTEVLYGSGIGNTGLNGGAVRNYGGNLTFSDSLISQALYDGLDTVGNDGAVTDITNSVFIGCDRAVVSTLTGTTVTIVNCTFDDNLVGMFAHASGSITVTNCIVSNSQQIGVETDASADMTITYSDVWTTVAGAVNYSGMTDPTGTNGDISADPNYVNAAQGDYSPNYLSPVIDSGNALVAPATDIIGDPLYNDPRTTDKPGVPNAAGTYAGMGAYTFVETAPSNVDLVVSSVSGPPAANVGDTVTVTWTDTNIGSGTAVGPWHDEVMLVQDPAGAPIYTDVGDVLEASGVALGPGQSKTFSSQFVVPVCAAGDEFFAVNPNCQDEVYEGENAGNGLGVALAPVSVGMTALQIDKPGLLGTFAAPGDFECYQITPAVGQTVHITLTGSGGTAQLYVGDAYVPSATAYDSSSAEFNSPNASLTISDADGDTYYVVATANSVASGGTSFTIAAANVGFSLYSVTPTQGGAGGTVTVTATGAAFPNGSSLKLDDGGTTILPTAVNQVGSTEIMATFNLARAPLGAADVVAYDTTGDSQTLPGAFTVVPGGASGSSSGFWFKITAPAAMRAGVQNTVTLSWGNSGDVDAPMELIEIPVPAGLTLTTTPGGAPVSTQLLLLTTLPNSAEAVLPPGYSASMQLYVTAAAGQSSVTFTATTVAINDPSLSSDSVDWDAMKAACEPAGLTAAEWNALWNSFTAQMGNNWAAMLGALGQEAVLVDQTEPYQPPSSLTPAVTLQRAMLAEIGVAIKTAEAAANTAEAPAPGTAAGAPPPPPPSPFWGEINALVVADENYAAAGVPNPPGAQQDANAWATYLENTGEASFVDYDVAPPGGTHIITATSLLGELQTLADNSDGETAFFTFSGHAYGPAGSGPLSSGAAGNGGLYLSNGDRIPYDTLITILGESNAAHIDIVLDACHSGALVDRLNFLAANPAYCTANGLPTIDLSEWTVVTSCTATEKAWGDASSGGFFDQAFIQSLTKNKGKAQSAFQQNQLIDGPATASRGLGLIQTQKTGQSGFPTQHPEFFGSPAQFVDSDGEVKDEVVEQVKAPTGKTMSRDIEIVGAVDPNDKVATGFGPAGFVAAGTPITYTVQFENSPTAGATAPAQEVLVTDQLSSSLDWSTLQLAAIGFDNTYVNVPAGHNLLSTVATIPSNPDPVYVTAALDPTTGVVTWDIKAIDPATGGLPADPFAGFLPVENGTGNGIGSVSFTILPKAGLSDGSQVTNTATITFDPAYGVNPPIATNQVVNTINATPPSSSVSALPSVEASPSFTVNWSGTDGTDSGIASYDVYVSDNGGLPTLWQSGTTDTSAQFTGVNSHTYGFYSVAADNVGNVEATPTAPEAVTKVQTSADLAGTWQFAGALSQGTFTMDSAGNVTSGSILSNGSASPLTLTGGTYTVNSQGNVTLTCEDAAADTFTWAGSVNAAGDAITVTQSPYASGTLGVMVLNSGTFSDGSLSGSWAFQNADGMSGSLTFDGKGDVTAGSLASETGGPSGAILKGSKYTVTADDVVTVTLYIANKSSPGGKETITWSGALNASDDLFAGDAAVSTDLNHPTLVTMTQHSGKFAASDLDGTLNITGDEMTGTVVLNGAGKITGGSYSDASGTVTITGGMYTVSGTGQVTLNATESGSAKAQWTGYLDSAMDVLAMDQVVKGGKADQEFLSVLTNYSPTDLVDKVAGGTLLNFNPAIPGDKGTVTVTVTDDGQIPAGGTANISLYLCNFAGETTGGTLLGKLTNQKLALGYDQSQTCTFSSVQLPASLTAGTYYLRADVSATLTNPAETSQSVSAFSAALPVAWEFGNVGTQKNVVLNLTETDGTAVSFSLSGAGMGDVTVSGDEWDLTVTGTAAKSGVTITTKAPTKSASGLLSLDDITVSGPLGTFSGTGVNLTGAMNVSGALGSLSLKKSGANGGNILAGASLNAGSIGTLSVGGSFQGTSAAGIAVNAASIGSLTVTGALDYTQLLSAGDIGSVSLGSMADSDVFAGVASGVTGLPSAESDFSSETDSIKTFTITGGSTAAESFINSNIAAWTLGTVNLGYPDGSNGGIPFGVACNKYTTLSFRNSSGKLTTWKSPQSGKFAALDGVVNVITS